MRVNISYQNAELGTLGFCAESVEVNMQTREVTATESNGTSHTFAFRNLRNLIVEPNQESPVNGQQAQDAVDKLIFNSANVTLQDE